eukprot:1152211-Pelagomonas_calceolata.AAC.1
MPHRDMCSQVVGDLCATLTPHGNAPHTVSHIKCAPQHQMRPLACLTIYFASIAHCTPLPCPPTCTNVSGEDTVACHAGCAHSVAMGVSSQRTSCEETSGGAAVDADSRPGGKRRKEQLAMFELQSIKACIITSKPP